MTVREEDILRDLKSPERKSIAFEGMVSLYSERLYFYIRRMVIDHDDCNDVVQNVFIKAWKGIHNFREDAKLSTWLFRIATNESITFLNKQKKIAGIPMDDVAHELPGKLSQDTLYDGDEIQRRLDTAVAALPEKQKAVFILKYFEDKKYSEIAEITGTSEGALKASYHHAVNKVKEMVVLD